MSHDSNAKCRLCRRAAEKLFLKGDRCATPKCSVVRRNYAPGAHANKGKKKNISEYGMQLAGKQKIKRTYGVTESQFRKHFKEGEGKSGFVGEILMARLEKRLDNVVYRLGLAASRTQARQLVAHGFVNVNGKKLDIPSFEVKLGDTVSIHTPKKARNYVKNMEAALLYKKDFPSWVQFKKESMEGKIVGNPTRDDIGINLDPQAVVEYYSR